MSMKQLHLCWPHQILVHDPFSWSIHTHTQTKETHFTTQRGWPKHKWAMLFLTDAFADSVLITTLQLLVNCINSLQTSREQAGSNINFCNYEPKNRNYEPKKHFLYLDFLIRPRLEKKQCAHAVCNITRSPQRCLPGRTGSVPSNAGLASHFSGIN